MSLNIEAISNEFAIAGTFISSEEIDSGLINSTYLATFEKQNGDHRRYILQRINENVFKRPHDVMANVERVTRHINWKVLRVKRDLGGQTLNLYPARGGKFFAEGVGGGVWRCYNFIEGCRTYDTADTTEQAYQAARAFGSFLDLVSDFPIEDIIDTIPNFHNTPIRYDALIEAVENDSAGRLKEVAKEVEFVKQRKELCSLYVDMQKKGTVPTRVTHNDTKINNVMIDVERDEAVCVIDLDTVMPGLSFYDFGDLIRTAISPHEEDSKDLSTIVVRLPFFKALAQGYCDGCESLTQTELNNMAYAGKLMTLEVGIRFLTDYLNGDVYFRTEHTEHNLDRCRTQFKLVEELEHNEHEFITFFNEIARSK